MSAATSSYELARSYAMSKGVLNADLHDAVVDPAMFFRIPHMLTVPAVGPGDGMLLLQHFARDANDDVLATPQPHAVAAVLSAVDPATSGMATLAELVQTVRRCCVALFAASLPGLLRGPDAPASGQLIAYVRRELGDKLLSHLDAIMPFVQQREGLTHLGMVYNATTDYFETKLPADTQDWLFTPSLKHAFLACTMPYLIVKFAAAFVRGPWNESGNTVHASFYDERYAELVMYRMAMSMFGVLSSVAGQDAFVEAVAKAAADSAYRPVCDAEALKAGLTLSRDNFRDALEAKVRTMESLALKGHAKVAHLSNRSKSAAVQLGADNSSFLQRQSRLHSLVESTDVDRRQYAARRRSFYAWMCAYVAVLLASVALLATKRTSAFLAMAASIAAALALYSVVSLLAAIVRWSLPR